MVWPRYSADLSLLAPINIAKFSVKVPYPLLKGVKVILTFNLKTSPRKHGLVVRVVAWEARRPGFDSSSDQLFSSISSSKRKQERMDPDMINCMIFRIHGDKRSFIP